MSIERGGPTKGISLFLHLAFFLLLMMFVAAPTFCSESLLLDQYQQLKAFLLDGKAAKLENLQLKRDRIGITLTGTVYLAAPIAGRVGIRAFCPSQILQNMAYNNGCSEGLGCHDIVVKDFGCTMSTDNQPAQPNRDYPWAP